VAGPLRSAGIVRLAAAEKKIIAVPAIRAGRGNESSDEPALGR
jgi:hypothetical protein